MSRRKAEPAAKRVSVFDVKDELLDGAVDTGLVPTEAEVEGAAGKEQQPLSAGKEEGLSQEIVSGTTPVCHTCGNLEFETHVEQREHFRTDWHRHNVNRKLKKKPPLTEEEFDQILETLSISGTDEEVESEEDEAERIRILRRFPRVELKASSGEYLTAWKDALPVPGNLKSLKDVQLCCVILCGGGHFAGTVFGPKGKVLEHRTFHRYTTRRKQGGTQDFNDKAARAKSAGASIRRYNMQLLRQEIRSLLLSWAEHIRQAELVFMHAPGGGTRELLLGFDDSPLKTANTRRLPFPTRRATFEETKRVMSEISSIYVSSESLCREQVEALEDAAAANDRRQVQARSKPVSQAQTPEKEKGTAHLKQRPEKPAAAPRVRTEEPKVAPVDPAVMALFEACCKGGPDELRSAAAQASVDTVFPRGCIYRPSDRQGRVDGEGGTPLTIVAQLAYAQLVEVLLELGADPVRDKPFLVAEDRPTRDAFRRFWAEHPDRWDYAAGGIPSPLTEDMEAHKDAKLREKRKKAKERKKEKQKQAAAEAAAAAAAAEERAAWEWVPKRNTPRDIAFASTIGVSLCLSVPAMLGVSLVWWLARRRLPERERRARALEGRMQTRTATCRWCGRKLEEGGSFERLGFRYCSTKCVDAHRREMGG